MRPAPPLERRRLLQAVAVALVVVAGLGWRSGRLPLSPFLFKYGGDALWALMVFLGLGFVHPRGTTLRIGLLALGVAWSVEFLQLWQAAWLEALRATRAGRLVLGTTFHAPDLLAYVVGIGVGMLGERLLPRWRRRPTGVATAPTLTSQASPGSGAR